MSWWLPKPMQQYLDNQLEMPIGDRQRALVRADFDANAASFKRVCAFMAGGDFAKMASSASPRSPIKTASCPSCITARGLAGQNFPASGKPS